MLLILLSWIYILITTINFGFLFRKIFRIQDCHIIIHQVLGLFLYAIITSCFAFFIRIHIEYYLFILLINISISYIYKKAFKQHLISFSQSYKQFKLQYKILYTFLFFLILAQSSTLPYLLDNESYYIQTIKWINEYGFVKGLANLHMFFGQKSSWHVLQAGFNFPFISNVFNDLNGFLFVLIGFYAIEKLNDFKGGSNNQSFNFGLILIFTLLLIQFVNTPSPDLIIFLIAPYIFYQFIIHYKSITNNDFKVFLSLVLFLCFVKVTMIVLSFLVLIIYVKNYKTLKNETFKHIILSGIILILFLVKNAIISGYLFYPIETLDLLNVDWKQPKELIKFYKKGTFSAGMNNTEVSSFGFLEKIKFWFTIPKLHGFFNKIYIILIVIFPWFIYKSKNKSGLTILYALGILQLIILWNSSPQYRFYLVFVIFLFIQIFTLVFRKKNIGIAIVYLSIIMSTIPLFFNINLNTFTNNSFAMKLSVFKLESIVIPQGKSKTTTQFSKQNVEGFEFNSPNNDTFFWSTGDGNLPCVNKKQIIYFKEYYNYIPQQRTKDIKDGFKSLSID